jgi:hypothetical protein
MLKVWEVLSYHKLNQFPHLCTLQMVSATSFHNINEISFSLCVKLKFFFLREH